MIIFIPIFTIHQPINLRYALCAQITKNPDAAAAPGLGKASRCHVQNHNKYTLHAIALAIMAQLAAFAYSHLRAVEPTIPLIHR